MSAPRTSGQLPWWVTKIVLPLVAVIALGGVIVVVLGGGGGGGSTSSAAAGQSPTSAAANATPGNGDSSALPTETVQSPTRSDNDGNEGSSGSTTGQLPGDATPSTPAAAPTGQPTQGGDAAPRTEEACRAYQMVGGHPNAQASLTAVYTYAICRRLPVTASETTCTTDMAPLAGDIANHRDALASGKVGEQAPPVVRDFRDELAGHDDAISALRTRDGLTVAWEDTARLCQETNAFQR